MSQTNAEQEVIQVENRRFQAMMDADTNALESILADELTYIHTSAALDTKESFIRRLASGTLKYESVVPGNMQVRSYGDTAVVTGNAEVQVSNSSNRTSFSIRFTDVLVQRDGRWQVVAWQSTRLPA